MLDRPGRLASESKGQETVSQSETAGDDEVILATYSSMTTHRKCPQMWKYRYLDRLGRAGEDAAPALEFGSWFHAVRAADRLAKGRREGTLVSAPESIGTVDGGPEFSPETSPEEIMGAAHDWWEALPEAKREQWVDFIGQEMPKRLSNAYAGWLDEWGSASEGEAVLAVEHRWERALPMPKGYDGPPVHLFGFIDEVYEDRRRGLVVVRDCKTSKSIGQMSAMDELMDSQVQLYAWGIAQDCKAWGINSPRAVSFDRVRTVAPKTPSLTKSGRLSKSVTDYDLRTYVEWVGDGVPFDGLKKDGSGAGVYKVEQDEVDRLSSDDVRRNWYRRSMTPLSVNIVKTHLRAAVDTVSDIGRTKARAERSGEAPRNLVSMICKWCDFAELCRAQAVGGPDGDFDPAEYGLEVRKARGSR